MAHCLNTGVWQTSGQCHTTNALQAYGDQLALLAYSALLVQIAQLVHGALLTHDSLKAHSMLLVHGTLLALL